jgi:hypothetical protein
VRRLLASLSQILVHDQLREIDEKTRRLAPAAVESATYLGGEVYALDRRVGAIEREVAELRRLAEPDRT